MDQKNLFEDLIQVTARLGAVLEKENALLRAMQPAKIRALQDDKVALANAYQALVRELSRDPKRFEDVAPTLRLELKTALTRFDSLAQQNGAALHAAQTVNRRVMVTLIDAVKKQQAPAPGYGRDGASMGPATKAPPLSLSLNQRL